MMKRRRHRCEIIGKKDLISQMHTLEISVDTIFSQQSVFLLRNFQYEFPDFFRINFFD